MLRTIVNFGSICLFIKKPSPSLFSCAIPSKLLPQAIIMRTNSFRASLLLMIMIMLIMITMMVMMVIMKMMMTTTVMIMIMIVYHGCAEGDGIYRMGEGDGESTI